MRSSVLLLVAALLATSLAAQEPVAARFSPPRPVFDLDAGGQQALGLGVGLAMSRAAPAGPTPRAARLSLIGRYSITGSREATLAFDAPALWRDWRVLALARSERMLRAPYFGFDNAAHAEDSLTARYGRIFYRHALLRSTAFVTLQRRIAGPLWLHAAGQVRRYRTSSLRQTPTLYGRDVTATAVPDTARFSGSEGRLGLIWDSRDDWIIPSRGLMVEAVVASGRLSGDLPAGSLSYQRYLARAREYLTLDATGRTILALRQHLALSSDTLPFFLAYEQLTSWEPRDGIVGKRAIRLHGGGEQLASNLAIVSVDLRRILIPPDWPERSRRLWITVFADAGLVWEPREAATLRSREWTLGTGLRIQNGRHLLTGFDVGVANTGPGLSIGASFGF